MAKKPLRISDDANDLQNIEFGDDELAGIGGLDIGNLGTHLIQRSGDDMIFEDVNAGGPHTLSDLLADAGARDFSYAFFGNSGTPYIQINNSSYVTIAEIIWQGTTDVGPVDAIRAILGSNDATDSAEVRIFDLTNTTTIATGTVTSVARQIISLTGIANVTTTSAIWEIQIKKTGSAARAQLSSVVISTTGN